jgi:hypothetical protein
MVVVLQAFEASEHVIVSELRTRWRAMHVANAQLPALPNTASNGSTATSAASDTSSSDDERRASVAGEATAALPTPRVRDLLALSPEQVDALRLGPALQHLFDYRRQYHRFLASNRACLLQADLSRLLLQLSAQCRLAEVYFLITSCRHALSAPQCLGLASRVLSNQRAKNNPAAAFLLQLLRHHLTADLGHPPRPHAAPAPPPPPMEVRAEAKTMAVRMPHSMEQVTGLQPLPADGLPSSPPARASLDDPVLAQGLHPTKPRHGRPEPKDASPPVPEPNARAAAVSRPFAWGVKRLSAILAFCTIVLWGLGMVQVVNEDNDKTYVAGQHTSMYTFVPLGMASAVILLFVCLALANWRSFVFVQRPVHMLFDCVLLVVLVAAVVVAVYSARIVASDLYTDGLFLDLAHVTLFELRCLLLVMLAVCNHWALR